MFRRKKKQQALWTHIGTGIHLDRPQTIIELGFPDSYRKGHFWCFGTTRVGKTRIMEHILEQDISKGYSIVAIDPKGDIDLFSKITQLADATGRLHDLMLITPIFPQYSAILDPLSSYYMPEELVAHTENPKVNGAWQAQIDIYSDISTPPGGVSEEIARDCHGCI